MPVIFGSVFEYPAGGVGLPRVRNCRTDRSFAASLDRGLARAHLWLKPAAPHGTREHDDDNAQHSSDSATQDHANDYVREDVSDAVCVRPEVIDNPAAQRQSHEDREEYAPGPPVTQPAAGLSSECPPPDTGFLSGREGVGWHAPERAISSGAASRSGNS